MARDIVDNDENVLVVIRNKTEDTLKINKSNIYENLINESKFHKRSSQTKASKQLEKRMKTLGINVNVNKLDNDAWVVLDSGVLNG